MPMNFVRLMIMITDEMEMKRWEYQTCDKQMGDDEQSEKCFQLEHGTRVLIAQLTSFFHRIETSPAPG